ncbi:MAG: DUF1289 domain-containing protein [Pseudomonadota bacterium]|nr:DUF1289 domain-containing protein [Pseudomonadota bacterium]MDO7667762.1 DUF1289 domain-containing protein [Pseudomonadota bacterium]MDO7710917.1 DUF1289 domain-containing protein [Pseudomonadota bacterium]
MTQINSPCVRNCCLNEHDICLGCFRSLDEIKLWGRSETSIQQKTQILANSATRQQERKNKY